MFLLFLLLLFLLPLLDCQAFVRGLRQMLDYQQDDFETVFCQNFVATYESFGEHTQLPLVPNGEHINVTQENKQGWLSSSLLLMLFTISP